MILFGDFIMDEIVCVIDTVKDSACNLVKGSSKVEGISTELVILWVWSSVLMVGSWYATA